VPLRHMVPAGGPAWGPLCWDMLRPLQVEASNRLFEPLRVGPSGSLLRPSEGGWLPQACGLENNSLLVEGGRPTGPWKEG